MEVNYCINIIHKTLFPLTCTICGNKSPNQRPICPECEQNLPLNQPHCERCALPLENGEARICGACLSRPPSYDHCIAPYRFEEPIDELINGFKFHNRLAHGRLLSSLLLQAIESSESPRPGLIIPVPLHRKRLQTRGYNQALELARPIGKALNIPVADQLCNRHRATPAQSGLKRKQRLKNLRGAFELTGPIGVESVAIIDDVVTTGSTIEEIARMLKRSGVNHIEVWAVARTPLD